MGAVAWKRGQAPMWTWLAQSAGLAGWSARRARTAKCRAWALPTVGS
jgi:hypothetical protein